MKSDLANSAAADTVVKPSPRTEHALIKPIVHGSKEKAVGEKVSLTDRQVASLRASGHIA